MDSAKRALLLSFSEKYSAFVISAASTMILARLLTPHDIGLYSIGAALTSVLAMFRDFGVATFLIQEPDLTAEKFHTALSISVLTALTIGGVIAAAGPFAAAFYGAPGIAGVMHVTAASLLFTAFNSVALTWYRREMRYGVLYRMTLSGVVCGTVTSVTLAALGFGYMALAWAALANVAGNFYISMRYWPRHFGFRFSLKHGRAIGAFGFYSMAGNLLQELASRCDDLIIGRIIGLAPLGLFSRANGLITMGREATVTAAMPVAMSVFAVSSRAGETFRPAYLAGVELLTGLVWPVFAFIGLMALPIIHLLFGRQWDASARPAHLLAIAGGIAALTVLHYPVYQAMGALRQRVRVHLVCAPVQILSMAVGAWFGLTAAAGAVAFSAVVEFAVAQRAVNRLIDAGFRDIARAVRKSACVALATAAGPLIVLLEAPPAAGFLWQPLAGAAVAASIAWPLAVFAFRHPLAREVLGAIRYGRALLARAAPPV